MSSNVRSSFTPPPRKVTTHTVSVKGVTTVSMHELLGTGGQKLLSETLDSLPKSRRKIEGSKNAPWLNWKKDDDKSSGTESHYHIKIQNVNIDLILGTSVAEISYSSALSTEQGQQALSQKEKVLQRTTQQTVNQTVNNLLAVAVARRMNQQVQQYARQYQRQEVRMRVRDSNVESYAFVGGR